MILSVSRRTDIPTYYSDWFFNRIKEEFLYVRNPMNPHQVSKIAITPDLVDCIVFWTKNPEPMLSRLDELKDYRYYFQFTLTGYGRDIEYNVPHKKEQMIPIFQQLSEKIGPEKVVWRYDPILLSDRYTIEYHCKAYEQIAKALRGYTKRCVISFVDMYAKMQKNMAAIGMRDITREDMELLAKTFSQIAGEDEMEIFTCAEEMDLSKYGIFHNSCIDRELVEQITGYPIAVKKDKNQRGTCGCVESIDVGTYNTCKNGCRYCYANYSYENVAANCRRYDPNSPILCGEIHEDDKITERKVKSLRVWQERIKI